MDYSLPASSVHGILQARILEWVAIPFSRESSLPSDWTLVSHMIGRFFTVWVTREQPWVQIPVPLPTRHMHLGKSLTSSCFWLLICKELSHSGWSKRLTSVLLSACPWCQGIMGDRAYGFGPEACRTEHHNPDLKGGRSQVWTCWLWLLAARILIPALWSQHLLSGLLWSAQNSLPPLCGYQDF